jgi:amino acid adenylation domain-containing protein
MFLRQVKENQLLKPPADASILTPDVQAENVKCIDVLDESKGTCDSLCQMISVHAVANPDAVAVSAGRKHLTYAELDARASQVAHRLCALGVRPGVVVGVCLTRSVSFVVGALAILKAGGAYLPLDPEFPSERLAFLLNDSGAPVLITESPLAGKFTFGSRKVVELDREVEELRKLPTTAPTNTATIDDLAYVIYTSGSTGVPKGVEITHRSLLNLIRWHQEAFEISSRDRATQLAGIGFDAAVWELWPHLTAGASVHFVPDSVRTSPEQLLEWLVSNRITISFVPTALAEFMIALEWPLETPLRFMLTGADTLHRYPSPRLPFRLVNNYGPTECTVVTTSGLVPATRDGDNLPLIGRPIKNVQIFVFDQNLHRVPDGQPGELFIGGEGLARGYRYRPDLTAERFIPNPFSDRSGSRLYRTGDRVRLTLDGEVAFLGRVDEQIKIAGYRIEPDEIVHTLDKHPAVQSSVVVAREDVPGTKNLVAYIISESGSHMTEGDLRSFLQKSLPAYMIPSVFVRVDTLPLTPNGKVDRAALPAPTGSNILRDSTLSEPQTPIEQRLAAILAKLLGVDRVGADDNFFLLGGHSLLGTQLIGRIRDAFGVDLSLRTVFDAPTVSRLATQIEQLLIAKLESMSEEEACRLLSGSDGVSSLERAG